jgi:hypothetical protein
MDEIQLISDDDGLAFIGDPTAVEEFLRSEGLWASSKKPDLRRLKSLFGIGADVAQVASEIAANSARWLKLTPESAHLYKKYRLMETKTPGVSHAMVGKPGWIQQWLQAEQGPGLLLTNPAMLSGAAGIMAQVASNPWPISPAISPRLTRRSTTSSANKMTLWWRRWPELATRSNGRLPSERKRARSTRPYGRR